MHEAEIRRASAEHHLLTRREDSPLSMITDPAGIRESCLWPPDDTYPGPCTEPSHDQPRKRGENGVPDDDALNAD